jgi:hypothetical protein
MYVNGPGIIYARAHQQQHALMIRIMMQQHACMNRRRFRIMFMMQQAACMHP